MSIVKRKIRLARGENFTNDKSLEVKIEDESAPKFICYPVKVNIGSKTQSKVVGQEENSILKKGPRALSAYQGTKIVRNYAQVLCSFGSSIMAKSFLKKLIEQKYNGLVEIEAFQLYIRRKKESTQSMASLRDLLTVKQDETELEISYKRLFSDISVVFLKFFAVNWIFSGKVKHKLDHLKCRHKMIRRVRNPEYFTFLKG